MMNRLAFLRRTALALAGGLIVGPEVLEQYARLTHVRKSFPSAPIPYARGWSIRHDGSLVLEGAHDIDFMRTAFLNRTPLTIQDGDMTFRDVRIVSMSENMVPPSWGARSVAFKLAMP